MCLCKWTNELTVHTVEIRVIYYYILLSFVVITLCFVPVLLCLMSFPPAHLRTLAPKHISPCAHTPVCSSLFSTSCFWRASRSWVLQRTCATCGMRSRRNRVRQRPRSISSSKSLCVRTRAGLCRPTGGSTWWQASSRLLVVWRQIPWKVRMYATFRSFVHRIASLESSLSWELHKKELINSYFTKKWSFTAAFTTFCGSF